MTENQEKSIEKLNPANHEKKALSDSLDSQVGCDHDLGYTYDYEGPSIFSTSTKNQNPKFEKGIVYWNYCPKCGQKLNPPNDIVSGGALNLD